ncbi:MAG: hypothetical protein K1W19_08190 [Lachnospiraceae bacterium]
MKKTLYFEGAGCVSCNDVENFRIRTAFTNKGGKKTRCSRLYRKKICC